MKDKIKFSTLRDDMYEKVYPLICKVMRKFGYQYRSPNWWNATKDNMSYKKSISTRKIKVIALNLCLQVFDEEEFKKGLSTQMKKIVMKK